MNSRTAAAQRGFRHELFLHQSTAELLEFVVPVVRDAVAAHEPTLLLLRPDTADAVQHRVGPSTYLTIHPALTEPGRPAQHVRAARPTLAGYTHLVHQEPVIPPALWPEWRSLEALLNIVLYPQDTSAVCAYDRRTLTDEMIADLHATHPLIAHDHHQRHLHNDHYQHPVDFLERYRDHSTDPVEHTTPAVELIDPAPGAARATVARVARRHRLPTAQVDNLVFATHEAVTNALLHGRPPTVLRLWAQPDRVTITVTDTGRGPTDALAGLLPPDSLNAFHPAQGPRPGPGHGLGLWLSHQLVDVAHRRHPDGYTIRLAVTRPAERTG